MNFRRNPGMTQETQTFHIFFIKVIKVYKERFTGGRKPKFSKYLDIQRKMQLCLKSM